MLEITIIKKSCRGCRLCSDDLCPTDVLAFDEDKKLPFVKTVEDCIACLSCVYICPSNAIKIRNYPVVQNFYRDIEFSEKLRKFI